MTTASERSGVPAAQLHFPRHAVLSLQALTEAQQRYRVRLIGEESPISLIVSAPTVDGKLTLVREQQPLVARAVIGKDILAFRTQVLKAYLQPFPHLHLTWPTSVERMPIRKSARVEIELPVSLKLGKDATTHTGLLVDLSATGARVICAGPMYSGDSILLFFPVEMDTVREELAVQAVVRSTEEVGRDPGTKGEARWAAGLEFVNLGHEEQMLLTAFVYHCALS